MKQTKVICDACGEEVTLCTGGQVRITERITSNSYDVCAVCMSRIGKILKERKWHEERKV